MSKETRLFMRLLVFFDLPTTSRKDRRAYTLFHRYLVKQGYDMIQYSVYGRVVNGLDNLETHMNRLRANLPPNGLVQCMRVTEKQFAGMHLLVGDQSPQEKRVGGKQMILL
tara:strand:- start:10044 stop:10376 length:333 start_codon:yes stop_codon:yes gene_type:complete